MVLRTTTNHENKLEMELCWCSRQVVEGRPTLARIEPECEYGLDVGTTNGCFCRKTAMGCWLAAQKREFGTFTKDLLEMSDWLGMACRDGTEHGAIPQCPTSGELGGTLSRQSRERGQAQEREDR